MPDASENIGGPPAIDQTGNLTIWWVPTIVDINIPKVTELNAAGAVRLTYSFTPGGFDLKMPQEKLDDERLSGPQVKQSLGKIKPELADLAYVQSVAAVSADVALATGGAGHFVIRRAVSEKIVATIGQKVRVVKTTLGPQADGPTDGNGKFGRVQAAVVEAVGNEVALVA